MHKYLIATAILAALTAASPRAVMAEIAPQAAATLEAAPVVASADADLMTRKRALVRRYFEAVNFDKTMDATFEAIAAGMTEDVPYPYDDNSNSTIIANIEYKNAAAQALVQTMAEIRPKYMPKFIDIYADAFTEDELTQMVNFYESPVGQSIAAKQPGLVPKTYAVMTALQPEIQAIELDKTCAIVFRTDTCKAKKKKPKPAS
ncbi:MAG TPA: DUF2059 domain-containing protein [Asticcacaulis sp.]|nr:DUF2059 domain-containing protein [Asticcacaulis sp.]